MWSYWRPQDCPPCDNDIMIISAYDDITLATPVSLPPLSLGDPGDGGGHREEEGGDPQGPVQGQHPHLERRCRLRLVTL